MNADLYFTMCSLFPRLQENYRREMHRVVRRMKGRKTRAVLKRRLLSKGSAIFFRTETQKARSLVEAACRSAPPTMAPDSVIASVPTLAVSTDEKRPSAVHDSDANDKFGCVASWFSEPTRRLPATVLTELLAGYRPKFPKRHSIQNFRHSLPAQQWAILLGMNAMNKDGAVPRVVGRFERNAIAGLPALRIKMIFVGIVGLVVSTGIALSDFREAARAGTQPAEMTMAQVRDAVTTPFVARWVRLTEPLQIECSQGLVWTESGKATMVVLAYESSRQQPFWLEYEGNHSCNELGSISTEGMLVEPSKFWIKHGMVQPSSPYPLLQLNVGETPLKVRKDAQSIALADLLFIAMLGFAFCIPTVQKRFAPQPANSSTMISGTVRP
jgi:hypothetical protein